MKRSVEQKMKQMLRLSFITCLTAYRQRMLSLTLKRCVLRAFGASPAHRARKWLALGTWSLAVSYSQVGGILSMGMARAQEPETSRDWVNYMTFLGSLSYSSRASFWEGGGGVC